MANNFIVESGNPQYFTITGDLDAFAAGKSSIEMTCSYNYLPTLKIYWKDESLKPLMKYIKIKGEVLSGSTTGSTGGWGYIESDGTTRSIANIPSPSNNVITYKCYNYSGIIGYWVSGSQTTLTANSVIRIGNLEILDANGNSLLESSEPSTGLPLYIGDSNIQAVKLGNVDISKMYIGNTLIYGT